MGIKIKRLIAVIDISITLLLLTGCVMVLKHPLVVKSHEDGGEIVIHSNYQEPTTTEQTEQRESEVTVSKQSVGVGNIQEINAQLERYEQQQQEQVKIADEALNNDSIGSPQAVVELLRVQLIDAKIRRTLCKNNYMTIQTDSTATNDVITEAKECWENSEQRVVLLTAEIRALKEKHGIADSQL